MEMFPNWWVVWQGLDGKWHAHDRGWAAFLKTTSQAANIYRAAAHETVVMSKSPICVDAVLVDAPTRSRAITKAKRTQ